MKNGRELINDSVSVATGEVKIKKGYGVLKAYALGSCIGIVAYQSEFKGGGTPM